MSAVRDYLAWYVTNGPSLPADRYVYRSIEDFVLRHGRRYEPQSLPSAYEFGYPKACYENSAKLASFRHLAYVEGFALCKGCPMPLHHAWCIGSDDRVIDTTWREAGEDYFGVVFPLNIVLPAMFSEKPGKGVLDDWQNGLPLLQKPFVANADDAERRR